jgi:hypothetical protein
MIQTNASTIPAPHTSPLVAAALSALVRCRLPIPQDFAPPAAVQPNTIAAVTEFPRVRRYVAKPSRRKDLTGKVFGHLVVVAFAGMRKLRTWGATWLCRCRCGNEIVVPSNRLIQGVTKSCGCLSGK